MKSNEVILQVTKVIRYRNQHAVIKIYNYVIFVVKFLITEKIFKQIFIYDLRDNGKTPNTNLF